jgi:hypothetical protein
MKITGALAIIVSLVILAGCGQSDESIIKEGIELDISKKYRSELISSVVEIKAFENSGTKIEPKYKTRFVAVVKLREPRYKKIETITVPGSSEFTLVQQVYAAGDEIEAFGTSLSELKAEQLITTANVSSFGSEDLGHLLDAFDKAIIKDSDEHDVVMREIKRTEKVRAEAVLSFRKKLVGKWGGTLACDNKEYGFTLMLSNITNIPGDSIAILEARYEDVETPGSQAESFELAGNLDLDGNFKLEPTKWITHANGSWAGFHGKYDESKEVITGKITKARNCSTFKASRI